MTSHKVRPNDRDLYSYSNSELEKLADLECNSILLEITEPCTLLINTSEWTQVYKLIKKGAENDLPSP